jgi:hypothetical protein
MGTNNTNGFDLVVEIAEDPIVGTLGDAIDASSFLSSMFGGESDFGFGWEIGDLSSEFSFDVSFDRDNDVLDATQTHAVDIRMSYRLGLKILGVVHDLESEVRWIVGAAVKQTDIGGTTFAQPMLDFADRLYHTKLDIDLGLLEPLIPGDVEDVLYAPLEAAMADSLKALLGKMVLAFPLSVDSASDDPKVPKAMDVATIGDTDTSPNAMAICISFGGASAGDPAGFINSFLEGASDDPEEPREPAWAMMDFAWIARLIAASLKETDAFADAEFTIDNRRCELSERIEIEDGVWLDRFAITFDPDTEADKFAISGKVAKRGFCYEASAELGGEVSIAIDNAEEGDESTGHIVVTGSIAEPDVDIDVPWYCWLVGALTFGLIFGPIGLGIVVALAIIVEVIEGIFDWIADEIVAALNGVIGSADIPTGRMKLKPVDAFIDDASIIYDVELEGVAPIRCEGYALLRPHQGLELDNGKVIAASSVLCDLRYDGQALSVGCGATLAECDSDDFERWLRFRLYDLDYQRPASINASDLLYQLNYGVSIVTLPSLKVFAIHSDQGRYSVFQVVHIASEYLRIRYRTYEGPISYLQLEGDFHCPPAFAQSVVGDPVFVPQDEKRPVKQCGCADSHRNDSHRDDSRAPVEDDNSSAGRSNSSNLSALSLTSSANTASLSHGLQTSHGQKIPDLLRPDQRCFRTALKHNHDLIRFYRRLDRASRACGEPGIALVQSAQQGGSADPGNTQPQTASAQRVSAQQLLAFSRPSLAKLGSQKGYFFAQTEALRSNQADFRAIAVGLSSLVRVSWRIDGRLLSADGGSFELPTGSLEYQLKDDDMTLHLALTDKVATEFALSCEVEDRHGRREHRARCVRYTPSCKGERRVLPKTMLEMTMLAR